MDRLISLFPELEAHAVNGYFGFTKIAIEVKKLHEMNKDLYNVMNHINKLRNMGQLLEEALMCIKRCQLEYYDLLKKLRKWAED
jgi:hypothetical protein